MTQPSARRFHQGNFAPVAAETTSRQLEVEGHIPAELNGRLLQIGPNPLEPSDHWFPGEGLLHGLSIRDGRAEWYRSRFMGDMPGKARIPTPAGANEQRLNSPNTNVMGLGGKVYAIVEAGSLPVEVDDELNPVAYSDFGGTLDAGFTAHPQWDSAARIYHALVYEPGSPLRYLIVDAEGHARTVASIDLPHCPMVHDVAVTESSVVVLDLPTTFQPGSDATCFPWLWNERQEARIGLLPRSGEVAKLQWFAAPRCFVFHFMNAYDAGDHVIVDVVRHPRMFATELSFPDEGRPILVRWTLDRRNGTLQESVLDDRGCEFPRINGAQSGRVYRYGYSAHWNNHAVFGPAFKHDVERQTTEAHDYGPGCATLEPVFVPRTSASAEDDGWILSYVYEGHRDKSAVVILDAQHFAGEPVATIRLPVRVPFGFHGSWTPY